MPQVLTTARLLAAITGLRTLVVRMQEETPDAPTDPALVEIAIRDLAPEPDWPYWLLAIEAAQNRAVGIIEGCLDHPLCFDEARDCLTEMLAQVVERGAGAELTVPRFKQLADRAFNEPLDIEALVAPACFVVDSTLTFPDPHMQDLLLGMVLPSES